MVSQATTRYFVTRWCDSHFAAYCTLLLSLVLIGTARSHKTDVCCDRNTPFCVELTITEAQLYPSIPCNTVRLLGVPATLCCVMLSNPVLF